MSLSHIQLYLHKPYFDMMICVPPSVQASDRAAQDMKAANEVIEVILGYQPVFFSLTKIWLYIPVYIILPANDIVHTCMWVYMTHTVLS